MKLHVLKFYHYIFRSLQVLSEEARIQFYSKHTICVSTKMNSFMGVFSPPDHYNGVRKGFVMLNLWYPPLPQIRQCYLAVTKCVIN